MRTPNGAPRFSRRQSGRAYAVHFTPTEFRRLERTGDAAQTIRLAVGTLPEDEPVTEEYLSRQYTFTLPAFLVEKINRLARANNASCSAVVRAAVRRYLEEEEP